LDECILHLCRSLGRAGEDSRYLLPVAGGSLVKRMSTLPPESPNEGPLLAEASLLLADYLDGGCSEADFSRLVARVGGMVYGSALRRTGDAQLAEEVMQNVFAILARKAEALRRHPSLAAWIFQTTRYEAAKAMRTEKRRRKKLEALAEDLACDPGRHGNSSTVEEAAWQEALPALYESLDRLPDRDRLLVLERFFDGKKFSEIAARSGRTEAACKMGMKRTLEKLSQLLTSRGVTLSGTALASALTAEFARSAPHHVMALITPKAIAASGGLTAATLITNSIQTMSTLKSVTLAGAAVLAVAAGPFIFQSSEASRLRDELAALTDQHNGMHNRLVLAQDAANIQSPTSPPDTQARTISDLLEAAQKPVDIDALIKSIMEVMVSRDTVGMIRVFLPVANLDKEEYERLMEELRNHSGNEQLKQMATQMLGSFAPAQSRKESLERMMALELPPHAYSNLLFQWAKDDPEAALSWYLENREDGALIGKAVQNTPEMVLLGELARGMAAKDPARAVALFERFNDEESRNHMIHGLADGLATSMRKSGDVTSFERFIGMVGEGSERTQAVTIAVNSLTEDRNLEQRQAFIEKYLNDADARREAVVNMLSNERELPLAQRAEWLQAHVTRDQFATSVGDLVQRMLWEGQGGVDDWLSAQPAGEARDAGYRALAVSLTNRESFEKALAATQRIEGPAQRANANAYLARQWMRRDPAAAQAALPAELMRRQ